MEKNLYKEKLDKEGISFSLIKHHEVIRKNSVDLHIFGIEPEILTDYKFHQELEMDLKQICVILQANYGLGYLYRGVNLDLLESAIKQGLDNNYFYADTIEKALEYGSLIYFLDSDKVEPSFRVFKDLANQKEITRLEKLYPFVHEINHPKNGKKLFFGHSKDERSLHYEMAHGWRYMGENLLKPVKSIIVFYKTEEIDLLKERIENI